MDAEKWWRIGRQKLCIATRSIDGVMGQVAAGLISGPSYRNAPQNFPRGMNPAGLVEGILRGVLR